MRGKMDCFASLAMTLDGSPLLRRNIPKPRAVRGDILDAVFQMHALVRGQLLGDAYAGPPFAGRIGRRSKPPPQFGQTLCSSLSAQSAQNVHS